MPSLANLLDQLEDSKRRFGAGQVQTVSLIAQVARRRFSDAESPIRFPEARMCVRSHPQSAAAFRLARSLLQSFWRRVDDLRARGVDMTAFDYIEYSGIARTTISGTFSYDIVHWLLARHGRSLGADWSSHQKPERLGGVLPRVLPLLYEESLVEANIPYLEWLKSASGKKRSLQWLVKAFERLELSPRERAELYDSLEIRVKWDLGDSHASRTNNWRPVRKVFYHTKPLIPRSQVSLDDEFRSAPIPINKLSRRQGTAMQDMLRETTTVRYRELYGITHGGPDAVVRADIGRG